MILGIDFGTCFSAVAYMEGTTPVASRIGMGREEGIPSQFMYSAKEKKKLYGWDCNNMDAIEHPEWVIKHFKKEIMNDPGKLYTERESGGEKFTLAEIVEGFLEYLIDKAKAAVAGITNISSDPEYITITSPVGSSVCSVAFYNGFLRDTICKLTGLDKDHVFIVQEPVAAAFAFLDPTTQGEKSALIFDLGGGTLDVTVVRERQDGRYDVVYSGGDSDLGGLKWDEKLAGVGLDYIYREWGKEEADRILSDRANKAYFDAFITGVKIQLSTFKKVTEYCEPIMDRIELDFEITTTREQFEKASRDLLERAMAVLGKVVDGVGGLSGIDDIVLVGGSSNMPQVIEAIRSRYPDFDSDHIRVSDPSKAIARGAAVYSKYRSENKSVERARRTYAFKATKDGKGEILLYCVIYKYTEIGESGYIEHKVKLPFRPPTDESPSVTFTVYETEFDDDGDPWKPIVGKECSLQVDVPVPDEYLGKATQFFMKPILRLDRDGVLEIIILDAQGNQLVTNKNNVTGGWS